MGSLQAVMGFASPIFNIIYINTLHYYVGTVYLVICAILAVLLALLAYTFCFLRGKDKQDSVTLLAVHNPHNKF